MVTPGMFIDPEHIPGDANLFLGALFLARDQAGLSFVDLSSGEFMATVVPYGPAVGDELARLQPAELVVAESQAGSPQLVEMSSFLEGMARTAFAGRPPSLRQAEQGLDLRLPEEYDSADEPALVAAAMAWSTLQATQRCQPEHVERLNLYQVASHLVLDAGARRNLELYTSIAQGGRKGSLLHAVDRTATPMVGPACSSSGWAFPCWGSRPSRPGTRRWKRCAPRPARSRSWARRWPGCRTCPDWWAG